MIKKLLKKIEDRSALKVLRWLYEYGALKFETYKNTNMLCVHTSIKFLGKEIDHITWTDLEIHQKQPTKFASRKLRKEN